MSAILKKLPKQQSINALFRQQVFTAPRWHPIRTFKSVSNGHPFFSQFPQPKRRPRPLTSLFSRAYTNGYSQHNTYESATRVIWILISLNTAVFLAWVYARGTQNRKLLRTLSDHTTLSQTNLTAGRYHTLLTSAFSHMQLSHFAFNMFTLHTFGSILSYVPGVGGLHVLSLGIGSALAGSLGWLTHQRRKAGNDPHRLASGLGASGMVMGVGAAAACLMPFAPMNIMFIPIAIPLWTITLGYFGIDAYYLDSGGKVGHSAHLGGAVFGLLYYFANLRSRGGVWRMVRRGLKR